MHLMKRCFLLFFVLWLTACRPIQPPAAAPAVALETEAAIARVESLLDNFHQAGLFTGVALIAQDGKILLSRGWGLADREQEIPNTPQTIFRIYQTSTQLTAAAMLLLEQEGKLKMTDPICDYLADCPAAWQPITIHHLLSHTAGLPDYFDAAPVESNEFTQKGATPEQLVALFRDLPLSFAPGEQRVWSHSGFVLAGLIIERVSGQPYGDFMQQQLFAPLGMTHSGYGEPSTELAIGYLSAWSTTPVHIDASAFYAAGGLYSTAEDLFRWNEALYNGQLLQDSELQKMLTAHATLDDNLGSGYGLVVGKFYGHNAAGNGGGGLNGYAARLSRFLDDKLTIVLIGNQNMEILTVGDTLDETFFAGK